MALSQADYLRQMQALLPPGAAWPTAAEATLTQLLSALAEEFARVDVRADELLAETDPRTTSEMMWDWERVAGLPDACAVAIDGERTTAQRRADLIGRLTTLGGQSRDYFVAVADAMGYEIVIEEFQQQTVDDDVELPIYDEPWVYAWRVLEPPTTIGYQTVEDTVDDPLAYWGIAALECMIQRLKPAHTTVLYGQISYSDGVPAADLYEHAALYGKVDTIAAIDRLHRLLHTTIPSWG